ncbi:MAG: Uma2 family endonuclease [Gammaproteobacteria bacterium]|nr:Uma2 family endonuclease [Gammaproteobacteria bacterium]
MTAVKPRIPYTYEDYRTLPEDMSRRYELMDGELYMVPAPTTRHQRVSRELFSILHRHVTVNRLGEVFYCPVDVILGEGDAREVAQPDIVFVAAERGGIIKLHGIEGAPDLVVEIVSPGTESRDRGYKMKLYARHGVREYLVVDPDHRVMEIFTPGPQGFVAAARAGSCGSCASMLLPGLVIPLPDVF